jgi:hypothetical protein
MPFGIGPDAIHSVPTFRQNGNQRVVEYSTNSGDVHISHLDWKIKDLYGFERFVEIYDEPYISLLYLHYYLIIIMFA